MLIFWKRNSLNSYKSDGSPPILCFFFYPQKLVALAGTNVVLTCFNRKLFGDDDGALDTRNYGSFGE